MAAKVKGPSRIITAEKTIANREAEERYLMHLRPLLFSPLCFFTIPRIITNLEIPTYCLLQQTAPHIAKNSSVKREAWQCSDVITIPVFPVSFPMKFPRDTAWLFWGGHFYAQFLALPGVHKTHRGHGEAMPGRCLCQQGPLEWLKELP